VYTLWLVIELIGVFVLILWGAWRFGIAVRRYLKLESPLFIAWSSQVIGLLLLVTALVILSNRR